jgi:RNA polymerase sigma-70 factor (ECF subfamily)
MPGPEEAQWVALYASLERRLFNVVYRILWNKSDSQDVVQDAFLRCWRGRARISPEGLEPVLFRTVLNLASNRRRSYRLWRFVGIAEARDEVSAGDNRDSVLPRSVDTAIGSLPDGLRRVLLLTEIAGMSYAEVAKTLGIREGTVGSRRTRAVELLREALAIKGEQKS